jgi:hypothetical protein
MQRWTVWAILLCALCLTSLPAHAQDAFEIQVYDPSLDPVGHGGLELHLNYVADGLSKAQEEYPEVGSNQLLHVTLEPSYGVTKFLEIGGYLQGAAGPGMDFTFGGAKLRAKFRLPGTDVLDFGLNFEFSYVPVQFEPNVWGSEIRPIMEYRFARNWLIDFNPIFDFDLSGRLAGQPQFEPCIALRYRLTERWLLSFEYYAAIGSLLHVLPWQQEYQAPFLAADAEIGGGFAIHFGVGTGLTSATNPVVIKSILSKDI